MSMFGVQLNAQINRFWHQIKVILAKDKTKVYFRDFVKTFFKYDKHQKGKIHVQNFEKALQSLGFFFKVWQLQVMYKAFGKDNDYHIYWQDFLDGIKYLYLNREPMDEWRIAMIERIWNFLDVRQEGALHYTQLGNLYNVQPIKQFKEDKKTRQQLISQFLGRLKINQDGKITKEQFIKYFDDFNVNVPGNKCFRNVVFKFWNYNQQAFQRVILNHQPTLQQIKAAIRQLRFKLIQKTGGTHEQFLLKKLYDQFDLNKDGYQFLISKLNIQQLSLMGIKLQVPIEQRLLYPIFIRFDRDRSNFIEYDEFKNFLFFDPYPI